MGANIRLVRMCAKSTNNTSLSLVFYVCRVALCVTHMKLRLNVLTAQSILSTPGESWSSIGTTSQNHAKRQSEVLNCIWKRTRLQTKHSCISSVVCPSQYFVLLLFGGACTRLLYSCHFWRPIEMRALSEYPLGHGRNILYNCQNTRQGAERCCFCKSKKCARLKDTYSCAHSHLRFNVDGTVLITFNVRGGGGTQKCHLESGFTCTTEVLFSQYYYTGILRNMDRHMIFELFA